MKQRATYGLTTIVAALAAALALATPALAEEGGAPAAAVDDVRYSGVTPILLVTSEEARSSAVEIARSQARSSCKRQDRGEYVERNLDVVQSTSLDKKQSWVATTTGTCSG